MEQLLYLLAAVAASFAVWYFQNLAKRRSPAIQKRQHQADYWIEYVDADGVVTAREISVLSRNRKANSVTAWCFLRNEERTFRLDRVLRATDLRTGRLVADLASIGPPAF